MNIFVLDKDPQRAAKMQCDKHIVKMPLETAQMLSTAHQVIGSPAPKEEIYKKTHVNHPCSKWVRENSNNYKWTLNHFKALLNEFKSRYKKDHATGELLPHLEKCPNLPKERMECERTDFVQAMPEEYKGEDAVKAYRRYYVGEKSEFAEWDRSKKPEWYDRYLNKKES